MRSIVLDFETFYGHEPHPDCPGADDYTLSKMTTEEYVRDPRFEALMVGVKEGTDKAYWVDQPDIEKVLDSLDIQRACMISHHAHFDGLILWHHYGIRPKLHIDTLSMARALNGAKGGNSLAKLCKQHGLPDKGNEVVQAKGKRRKDFTYPEIMAYGRYCINDCEREYELAQIMVPQFQRSELQLIDRVVRCFTEPVLQLRTDILEEYVKNMQREKLSLLMQAGLTLEDVMSADKFAAALEFVGVTPPKKISPTTGKPTWAFAKTDEAMTELAEHPDEVVQVMVAARLKNRSTINETRALRLISMAKRGLACVYYLYSGASGTHRLSGGDKMNWQNHQRGGTIREAVEAPDGYIIVVGDSSNIEARTSDWLAGEKEQLAAYRAYDAGTGPDIYCVMASKIYSRTITKKENPNERQMGKVTKLMLGYNGGADMLKVAVRRQAKGPDGKGLIITDTFAQDIVNVYRNSHRATVQMWKRCHSVLEKIALGVEGVPVDSKGIVVTCKDGLLLPNGLVIQYRDLKKNRDGDWTYFDGKQRQYIYGGKVWENIIQALAREIVLKQCLMVKHRLVMSSHDEGAFCVPLRFETVCKESLAKALRTPLEWCPDLPLNCEIGSHKSYGKAKQ